MLKNRFTTGNARNTAGDGQQAAPLTVVNNYNKDFATRKALLGDSVTVNCEIPLKRYSFFEALEDNLLSNTKIELNIEIEKDSNLIWRAGGNNCRVIITRLQLFVPRLSSTLKGRSYTWKIIFNLINGLI